MKACILVMLWLFLAVVCCEGVEADDDVVPDSATHVKFDFAKWCKVGGHTFVLESTTLADVVRVLGSGTIRGNGKDSAGGEYYVGFVLGHELVRFSSNAEMGGDDHQLEEIEVRPFDADDRVAALPSLHDPVTFKFGAVGMPFANFVSALGPAVRLKNIVWYDYTGEATIRDSSGKHLKGEIFSSLRAKIIDERVESIQLGRVTSF